MCERRARKLKKGSQLRRLREARRLRRLQDLVLPNAPVQDEPTTPVPPPQPIDKNAQCRLIVQLALKTISLVQKNSLIQQRIKALQKETSEFVAAVMNNPENQKRYLEYIRVHGKPAQLHLTCPLKHGS